MKEYVESVLYPGGQSLHFAVEGSSESTVVRNLVEVNGAMFRTKCQRT